MTSDFFSLISIQKYGCAGPRQKDCFKDRTAGFHEEMHIEKRYQIAASVFLFGLHNFKHCEEKYQKAKDFKDFFFEFSKKA